MLERLLTRLERKFGRYAFGNVTYYLVGLQALGFALVLVRPDLAQRLALDGEAVLRGEWWRLLTFLISPVATSPLWVVFALYWLYTMGSALEEHWGSFRYELYWLIGIAMTLVAVFVGGSVATVAPLVMSLFLAFATLWPDYQLRIFFILPVPVKWLAVLDAIAIGADVGMRQGLDRLVPLAAVANYLLFFGPTLKNLVVRFFREGGRARARANYRQAANQGVDDLKLRQCAICGASPSKDPSVELRVCSCEKCGGVDRNLCLAHARSH